MAYSVVTKTNPQREFCSVWRIRRSQRELPGPSARRAFDSQFVFQREHSDAAFGCLTSRPLHFIPVQVRYPALQTVRPGMGTSLRLTSRLSRQRCRRQTVKCTTAHSRRDLCDKYLTVFMDFKIARSFFDASLAAVPFTPDPFKQEGSTSVGFSPAGISVPIINAFNPFTVADADGGS